MAEEIDCADLGLPSDFFTEDFFVEKKGYESGGELFFPPEFPYDWVWSSPPGPDASGQDYLAELTWQMAHYFLLDDDKHKPSPTKSIICELGKSPENEPFSLFPAVLADKKDNFRRSYASSSWVSEQPKKVHLSPAWQRSERSAPPTWAPASLHYQPERPTTRAVVLGANRGSGTGVFLPRQLARPAEPKKNPGMPISRSSSMPSQESKRGFFFPSKTGPECFLPADWTY